MVYKRVKQKPNPEKFETLGDMLRRAEANLKQKMEFRRRFLVVVGPLFKKRIKGRSRRGWTTAASK